MSFAHMGQTAYVPKMLLLYVPLDLLPGSPRLKLILITLAINIATFILLGMVLERILREFGVRIGGAFYAGLLWLSTIAGSAFWIEFANSRNLEVVGGLFWIYLGLRYLRYATRRRALALVAVGGLVFFSDPLQLYMSAVPLLVYALAMAVTKHVGRKTTAQLLGITVAGYLVARLLFVLAGHGLRLSFSDTGNVSTPPLSLVWIEHSVQGAAKAFLSLFAGAADAGRGRELTNLAFVLLALVITAYTFIRKLAPKRLGALVTSIGIVDIVVYVASGQAVQGAATNRYLIMLAPVVMLALATVHIPKNIRAGATSVAVAVIGINVLALGLALERHWNTGFPQDAHIASTYRYATLHPKFQLYASTDTAMPLLYLYHLPAAADLPLGCLVGRLTRTHFSMDGTFARAAASPSTTAALVFDDSVITNAPNICTPDSVIAQFGSPLQADRTDDNSIVLLYSQSQLKLPN